MLFVMDFDVVSACLGAQCIISALFPYGWGVLCVFHVVSALWSALCMDLFVTGICTSGGHFI